jgi:hypothetical protein
MRSRLRPRSVYDVLAVIGCFAALTTGGAYAVDTVGSEDVIDESLLTQDIKNGEVRQPDIADDAVTGTKIRTGNVFTSDISTGAVVTNKIGPGAVVTDKLADGAVVASKVRSNEITGEQVYEPSLGTVPSAADAARLGGLAPASFMRGQTVWKKLDTIGERLPVEIGNPPCSGNRTCTATLRCDPGDVLLSGGFNSIDNGTRLFAAFPFNANGYDHKYVIHWENNSTADTVTLNIVCANNA